MSIGRWSCLQGSPAIFAESYMLRNALSALCLIVLVTIASLGQTAAASEKQRYELASAYSDEHRGLAVVVIKGDAVVYESYRAELAKDLPWILASGTKSFSGVMCAAAIEDKLIKGFDEKVSDTITEWKGDSRKSAVTIRQLLSLTSGIEAGQIGFVPTYAEAITRPARYDPGTHFEYGPVPFQIFGEVMTRKLKSRNENVMTYLKRRILNAIGLEIAYWRTFNGQPLLPQGLSLTAREWAKFGQLLKDRGRWNGKQIIKASLLDELTTGTKANPAYGLTFWLNADGVGPSGSDRPGLSGDIGAKKVSGVADLYMAAGAGNQRLYIIPSQDLVVVRFGAFGNYDDRQFISKLLTGK